MAWHGMASHQCLFYLGVLPVSVHQGIIELRLQSFFLGNFKIVSLWNEFLEKLG